MRPVRSRPCRVPRSPRRNSRSKPSRLERSGCAQWHRPLQRRRPASHRPQRDAHSIHRELPDLKRPAIGHWRDNRPLARGEMAPRSRRFPRSRQTWKGANAHRQDSAAVREYLRPYPFPPARKFSMEIMVSADQRQFAVPEQRIAMVEPSGRRRRQGNSCFQSQFVNHGHSDETCRALMSEGWRLALRTRSALIVFEDGKTVWV